MRFTGLVLALALASQTDALSLKGSYVDTVDFDNAPAPSNSLRMRATSNMYPAIVSDSAPNLIQASAHFYQKQAPVMPPQGATSANAAFEGLTQQRLVDAEAVNPLAAMSLAETGAAAAEDEGANLEQALNQIKDDIVSKSHQVIEEKKWVDQVRTITNEYELKMHRVNVNIAQIRNEVKDMFKKKKQIENLMLQKKLQEKLKDATSDLSTLQGALQHTSSKARAFAQNKANVEQTIAAINSQLSTLQGHGATPAGNPEADMNAEGLGEVNAAGNAAANANAAGNGNAAPLF